ARSSAFDDSEDSGRTPCIELFTNSPEALREAQAWAVRMLHMHSTSAEVKNNLIVHFGQEDHTALMNLQAIFNVVITEFFRKGKCGILIIGGASVAISSAAIHVESMLCQAQDYFAQIEEEDLLHSVVRWEGLRGSEGPRISFYSLYSKMPKLPSQSYYERTPIDLSDSADKERQRKYVEKMENYALKQLFELNRERVMGKPQWLYQCVRAQFCDQICRVGFQREYAPPEEQGYGAGIYFTTEMKRALELWEDRSEEFIYIIEAQVLTGKSIKGSPELIVPPPTGSDPLDCYNSVTSDLKDIYVIFHSQQALPQFLITCTKILTLWDYSLNCNTDNDVLVVYSWILNANS
uniref:PARP catalytic domain-containing protein n=1 Tax=Electrophorus electricus TaxID=8005 RepID=A0A4W4H878_ELEEL